jgi:hypothetical protein
MGNKEFKKDVKKQVIKTSFAQRQQIMAKDLEKLQNNIITKKFNYENRLNDPSKPTSDELKEISSRNLESAKDAGIQNSHIIFLHHFSQQFVEKYIIINNYNIFKTLKEIVNNLDLSEEEIECLDITEQRFEKEFPLDLKLVKYNIKSKDFKDLSILNYLGINSNLKFNKKYQPEMLTLIIDEELLDNNQLVRDIADLISICPTLIIVNYILYPKDREGKLAEVFGLDGETYQSLFALIKAVTVNRKIKSFVLHSLEYYNLNLAPEICRLIEQKLQSETLVAFHFGNFNLNGDWLKKIEFLLASTKSLLFLSYENKSYTKDDVLKFKNVIAKNRSIMAVSIVTPIFKGMKKEVMEKIKQNFATDNVDSKLELVYLSHKSLVDKSWFNS